MSQRRSCRKCRNELIDAKHPPRRRDARHDAKGGVALLRGGTRPGEIALRYRFADDRPDGSRTPASSSATAAPRTSTPVSRHGSMLFRRVADPHASDAQAADKADLTIDAECLAMVATEPAEGRVPARRVIAAHFDAACAQTVPECTRRCPEAAEPVIDQAHVHAFPCFGDEGIGEHAARIVVVNDVALEMDVPPRSANGVEPCRIVVLRVFEQPNAVAGDQRRSSRARERLVGKRPDRRQAFGLVG